MSSIDLAPTGMVREAPMAPEVPEATLSHSLAAMVHATPSMVAAERGRLHTPHLVYRLAKRAMDATGAALLLLLLSPVILAVAFLVWRSSPGCVIFRQTRVGLNGKPFTCLKFRTMIADADTYLASHPELLEAYAKCWKLEIDPRVTRLGQFLRKSSLDELPQLFNVLRGDMSLVGPRPYLPRELEGEFGSHAAHITSVRPGITGLWQVSGRSKLLPHQRVELDRVYADTATLRLDLRILIWTFITVLITRGAM